VVLRRDTKNAMKVEVMVVIIFVFAVLAGFSTTAEIYSAVWYLWSPSVI
jgi:hypothetical protein